MSPSDVSGPASVAPAPLDTRLPAAADQAMTPMAPPVAAEGPPPVAMRTSRLYGLFKRLFDVAFCLAVLVLLAPVFLVLALAVKLGDGGPVFHGREVVGRHGKRFHALKFRTMIPRADEYLAAHPELLARYASQVKLQDDPRITRVGRVLRHTSLDELPQFFNVLVGQMSLVGPRIIHPSEVERFGEFVRVRQVVRPGITGLWQVSGRQQVSYAQRVALDEEYMRRRSFGLDMRILFKTVVVVLRGDGAY
jgi:exopolysaccharide production protein ExoY